jgi:hypothetical protein
MILAEHFKQAGLIDAGGGRFPFRVRLATRASHRLVNARADAFQARGTLVSFNDPLLIRGGDTVFAPSTLPTGGRGTGEAGTLPEDVFIFRSSPDVYPEVI